MSNTEHCSRRPHRRAVKLLSPAMVRALTMAREGRGEFAPLRTLYALRDRGLVTVRAHYYRRGGHSAGGESVQVTVALTSGAS